MARQLLDRLWAVSYEHAIALCEEGGSNTLVLRNYIDGVYRSTAAEYIDSINPKTGKVFARVPNSSKEEVDDAVSAAAKAFPAWSTTARSERSRILLRIADLISERRNALAIWESIDQGKTLERALVEVDRAEANFRYFATYILHEETASRMIDDNVLTYEHRAPLGVFALVSPWNMPIYLLTWKIAPCLAFGCTGIAKPSELTSLSAFLLADLFNEAGLPPGAMNIVFGAGNPTGSALVRSKLIKGVSFTGGTATGIQIRKDTVEDIGKHLSLELGGKNPTLIFEDADLDQAVKVAAMAAFENQGEICLCGSRIYVEESIRERFIAKFTAFVDENYKIGGRVGAVVSSTHYQKVRGYLEVAASENARFELGEIPEKDPLGGYWIRPVILTGLSTSSIVMRDEIFGPVVTVASFATEQEAVNLANDNPNGLAAVVLTKDHGRMRRVGEQIEAGMIWVNCWLVRQLGTPLGGMKSSGNGREGGSYSWDVFTNLRTLHVPM